MAGRKPVVGLTLSEDMVAVVDAYAEARGQTRSKALHDMVNFALGLNLDHVNIVEQNLKTAEPTTIFVRRAVKALRELPWNRNVRAKSP